MKSGCLWFSLVLSFGESKSIWKSQLCETRSSHASEYWRKKGNLSQCGTRQCIYLLTRIFGLLVNLGCPWFLWPWASACPVWDWTQTYFSQWVKKWFFEQKDTRYAKCILKHWIKIACRQHSNVLKTHKRVGFC